MISVQHRRPVFWFRLRNQLLVGVLVAAIFPFLLRLGYSSAPGDVAVSMNTLVGTSLAITFGAWLMRNVTTYPGSEAFASVLSSFLVAFAGLLIIFVFARIPYARVNLTLGFILALTWFFVIGAYARRRSSIHIGVLPFGSATEICKFPDVEWRVLSSPDEPVDELDAIAVDLKIDVPDEWDRKLADYALSRIPVYHVKHLQESLTGKVQLNHLSENSFGSLAPRQDYMLMKFVIDWIAAFALGIALLPVMAIVAVAIRITSPGPALFKQERMGYLGRPFMIYKFRTMRVSHAEGAVERNAAITLPSDNRITSLGRLLRKSRLDELPQIINVLKGEMSWIGPRPEAMVLSRWYEQEIPFYRYRHIVRPGIAGWAQVCQGHVAEIAEVNSKLHFDFYYIKHYSPWIDLLIVLRTIRTMLTGHGAR